MFFNSKSPAAALPAEKLEAHRNEIKDKLAEVEKIGRDLEEAVRQTQEMSSKLSEKISKECKTARKSLTSISAKLREGLIIMDSSGKITHLNRTGLKIFGLQEKDVIGKTLVEVIECGNNLHDANGNIVAKPILRENFFSDLSQRLLDRVKDSTEKYLVCNECLKDELPFCFDGGIEHPMAVEIIYQGRQIKLKVTLSVLDNDPDDLIDVNYIFLFSVVN